MSEPSGGFGEPFQPSSVFRAALHAAAADERKARTRRPERIEALRGLSDADLAALAVEFDALLKEAPDVLRLSDRLHDALRALAPAPEGEDGHADAD